MEIKASELNKYEKLRLECKTDGHSKFYVITRNITKEGLDTGKFIAQWGKIGAKPQSMTYQSSDLIKKYNEKIKKGYIVVNAWENGNFKDDLQKYFEEMGDAWELD